MKIENVNYWEISIGKNLNKTITYLATSQSAIHDVYGNEIPMRGRIKTDEARGHVVYDYENGD